MIDGKKAVVVISYMLMMENKMLNCGVPGWSEGQSTWPPLQRHGFNSRHQPDDSIELAVFLGREAVEKSVLSLQVKTPIVLLKAFMHKCTHAVYKHTCRHDKAYCLDSLLFSPHTCFLNNPLSLGTVSFIRALHTHCLSTSSPAAVVLISNHQTFGRQHTHFLWSKLRMGRLFLFALFIHLDYFLLSFLPYCSFSCWCLFTLSLIFLLPLCPCSFFQMFLAICHTAFPPFLQHFFLCSYIYNSLTFNPVVLQCPSPLFCSLFPSLFVLCCSFFDSSNTF